MNFHLVRSSASPSPTAAVNREAPLARGAADALRIDKARMLSPGILGQMQDSYKTWNDPRDSTLMWNFGRKIRRLQLSKSTV